MPGERVLLLETLECSPITATQIKTWTARDPVLLRVAERVLSGWSNTADKTFIPNQRRRDELSLEDGCLMWGNPSSSSGGWSSESIAGATRGSSRYVQDEKYCRGSGVVARNRCRHRESSSDVHGMSRASEVASCCFTSPVGMASPSLGASPHRLCRSVFGKNFPRGGCTFQMA